MRIGSVQVRANNEDWQEVLKNYSKEGEERNLDLIVFPEAFVSNETRTEEVIKKGRTISKEFSLSFILTKDLEAYVFNKGEFLGKYRKLALFCDEKEKKAGNELKLFKIGGVKIGVMICYDLYFPEYARILTSMGADLIVHSSSSHKAQRTMWEALVKARSIENQLPLVTSCSISDETPLGGSMIVTPHFEINKSAGYGEEKMISADIEIGKWKKFREKASPVKDATELFKKNTWGPFLKDRNEKVIKKYSDELLKI